MPITDDAGFTRDEVGLALRNPGMPLEALRRPITPIGMHYVLIHFDVPDLDAAAFELVVDGLVRTPLSLTLDELRARPAVTMAVMMECAGSGRAHLAPRPVSAPWHDEAIGCAEWTGTPLRGVLEDAGLLDEAVELLFTGHDRGIDQGVEQDYQRSLTIEEAMGGDVLLAYAMNGEPLPASHGFPLRLVVPEWYGMASVKWLRSITAIARAVRGRPADAALPLPALRGRAGHPGHAQAAARAHGAARDPGVPLARPPPTRGPYADRGSRLVGGQRRRARRVQRRRRADVGGRPARRVQRQARLDERGRTSGSPPAPATTSSASARPTPPATRSPSTAPRPGIAAATASTRSSAWPCASRRHPPGHRPD